MFVKNTSSKVIGFGSVIIPPRKSEELPSGFGENHPTVKFYLAKGWLTPSTLSKEEKAPLVTEEESGDAGLEAKIKALSKMKLAQLQEEAKSLGIEFTEDDAKDILAQKITGKYQAE